MADAWLRVYHYSTHQQRRFVQPPVAHLLRGQLQLVTVRQG